MASTSGKTWFTPKRYGYGATPVSWQGWALTIGFVAAVFLLGGYLIGFDPSAEPDGSTMAIFILGTAILVAALWIVAKRTTDGEWRWRWGDNSK